MTTLRKTLIFAALFTIVVLILPSIADKDQLQAQEDDACTTLLDDALQVVGVACAEIGRNEACYGHYPITVEFQEDVSTQFASDGDLIDIVDLESLVTNPADPETGEWGVALMLVQADLPEDTDANMTFVLFGDVEVASAVEDVAAPTTCNVTNTGTGNINIRGGAGTDREIAGTFVAGSEGIANGRNDAGDWLRVEQGDSVGWVFSDLVSLDCDAETLAVVSETDSLQPISAPMQAITLRSGENDSCESAPDGLLIRSPEGRRARVMVNGVEMVFSSAGFLTAQADEDMMVRGLEGEIRVTAEGVVQTILPDTFLTIPLDANLQASGPPESPQQVQSEGETFETLDTTLDLLYESEIGIEACMATANGNVNTRGGPGTAYRQRASLNEGQERDISGKATGTDGMLWWRIGTRWVRGDLVTVTGDCSRILEITDIDPPPTAVPSSGSSGGSSGSGGGGSAVFIYMNGGNFRAVCQPSPLAVGTLAIIHYGTGFQTEEEAAAAYASTASTISINGENQPVTRGRHPFCPPSNCPPAGAYGFITEARWRPTEPGTYTILGIDGYSTFSCVIAVE